ncbi:hypothetical protein [Chryseobacterium geocarposphaerae]|uniref:Uncharacterized protein n=1 Tax=Chryseobacterium geocarposphaerae TaxID=1416776 RepID=A0A2M9CBI5_9FLAO|nr:hypothetical protein [Chryseobacterium geocarposphaerae]PJJ68171.1 hypothetical protein CLV73_2206 [Chryseobacterium geocarposphaerae]
MKAIILSFLMIVVNSCSVQSHNNPQFNNIERKEIDKIELKEQTRGTNRSFVLNSEYLITVLNENTSKSKVSLSEWENIEKQINLIELSKISSLAAPTTGRYSDQALASTIIVISNGKTYQSSSFDAGNPPKELASLYKAIQQIIQNKKTTP